MKKWTEDGSAWHNKHSFPWMIFPLSSCFDVGEKHQEQKTGQMQMNSQTQREETGGQSCDQSNPRIDQTQGWMQAHILRQVSMPIMTNKQSVWWISGFDDDEKT